MLLGRTIHAVQNGPTCRHVIASNIICIIKCNKENSSSVCADQDNHYKHKCYKAVYAFLDPSYFNLLELILKLLIDGRHASSR